jgi:hypothetical protein
VVKGIRAAVLSALVLALVSCSTEQTPPVVAPAVSATASSPPTTVSPTPGSSVPTATASPVVTATPSPGPSAAPGELGAGPLQHIVRSRDLTVSIEYLPDLPVERWTADGAKPVQVSVTVSNRRAPRQKVFLTRATMRFTVNDGVDDVPGPDPLVDTANITPGYLATSPYSYNQSFAIPSLDVSAQILTIDLKLEMVSLVDAKAKDYTKQTVTDTVRAAVAF